MQYIQESNSPVSYFVTGAGRLTDSSEKHKVSTPQQHSNERHPVCIFVTSFYWFRSGSYVIYTMTLQATSYNIVPC